MKNIHKKPVFVTLILVAIVLLFFLVLQPIQVLQFHKKIALLFPSGIIALDERNLLFIVQGIMLLIVLPVYALTFIFSWKYNSQNLKAKYEPDLIDNRIAEYFWWGIPLVLTLIICAITWITTHELDPYKPLASDKKPIKIQVIALQWKWLFLYPEENIAVVNFFQIPENTPIDFEITADAPMNSFWLPHLGGQIYAMPKMRTELHLIADERGDFRGSSANISGEGFADMHFITRASTEEDYRLWIAQAQQSSKPLDFSEYEKLAAPNTFKQPETYQLKDSKLFERVIMKYMHPQKSE